MLDEWYQRNLVCPIDRSALKFDGKYLVSENHRQYPVVDGVPVMLLSDEEQTIEVASATIEASKKHSEADDSYAKDPLYIETLGINKQEKDQLRSLVQQRANVDPVALMLVAATCGNAYKHLIGDRGLKDYPIPSINLTPSKPNSTLLDIGCNWGRWSIAAARQGFAPVGIDPSLGAIMAARRIARQMGLDIKYLVADARFLPFRSDYFKSIYSYSVLQHFSKIDAQKAILEIERVMEPGGTAKIQMANKWGLRSLHQQVWRGLRQPRVFDVQYWTMAELKDAFSRSIGETSITADCFFGLGWRWSDFQYMTKLNRLALTASELLRKLSGLIPPMRVVADSLFCTAVKRSPSFEADHGS
jgi:2-polyprenyl-3-methyl-5-hydroxy-6-metoxy-1,4-benzoquinol methylase/uncharacterized protein YbaR (Trm112 family)